MAWLLQHTLIPLVVETVATKTVAKVHVYHSPRCQDGLLVGITECVEYRGYSLYALLHRQVVGSTSHRTYALACLTEYVSLIVFLELSEHVFCHALWHELRPRGGINYLREVVYRYLVVLVFQFRSIDQQRHPYAYATQYGDGVLSLGVLLFQLFQACLLLRRQLAFLFLLKAFLLLIFLVGETLVVHVNVGCLCHCLRGANLSFQVLEVLQFHIRQLQQFIVV